MKTNTSEYDRQMGEHARELARLYRLDPEWVIAQVNATPDITIQELTALYRQRN
jgi:hypothetical protein